MKVNIEKKRSVQFGQNIYLLMLGVCTTLMLMLSMKGEPDFQLSGYEMYHFPAAALLLFFWAFR